VKALPADPAIASLALEMRQAVGRIWFRRGAAETRAGKLFEVVRDALGSVGASSELLALAEAAIDDEARHGALCNEVARAYDPRLPALSPEAPAVVPSYVGAPAALKPHLVIVGMCAINETTASAFLEASIASASGVLVRAALRALLSDEIHHARIGWIHLASPRVGDAERGAIGGWLPSLLAAHVESWREIGPESNTGWIAEQGCLAPEAIQEVVWASLRDLVLPGLDRVGIDTRAARAWVTAESTRPAATPAAPR
jgi:hypothetical protein